MIGALFLLGIPAFALFKKHRNPHWTPFSTLFATPRELNAALERVRITSVPTPTLTSALDPGMSSEHVKAVNVVLTSETDPAKIKNEAKNAKGLGFHNTSKALDAKASAVGQAKAKGASDDDIQREHLAAQTSQGASAAATHAAGWDGYGIEHHRHHGGDFGGEWGQQQGFPHPHHHRRHHEQQEDLGGDEEIDPRMLRWLMKMMQQQQHPHHHHHHHQQQFGGDFGFEETPMPRHHFETRGPVAHPHGAFQVPPHGGGGGGGGHHGFGHGGFGHGGFGHGGFGDFGYGGLGYEVDPYLFYPQPMDMGDDMMFDESMMLDDGGF